MASPQEILVRSTCAETKSLSAQEPYFLFMPLQVVSGMGASLRTRRICGPLNLQKKRYKDSKNASSKW